MLDKIKCFFDMHDWTNKYEQGIAPDPKQIKNVNGFFKYAALYCKHCGKVSEVSKEAIKNSKGH